MSRTAYWIVAVASADDDGPLELESGLPVMGMGGFKGSDPVPTVAQVQAYVASGELRYVIVDAAHGGAPPIPGVPATTRIIESDASVGACDAWLTRRCQPAEFGSGTDGASDVRLRSGGTDEVGSAGPNPLAQTNRSTVRPTRLLSGRQSRRPAPTCDVESACRQSLRPTERGSGLSRQLSRHAGAERPPPRGSTNLAHRRPARPLRGADGLPGRYPPGKPALGAG